MKSVLAGIAALIVAAMFVIAYFGLRFSALRRSGALDGVGAVPFGINQTVFWGLRRAYLRGGILVGILPGVIY